MRVVDPGHFYALNVLPSGNTASSPMHLQFVKRMGPNYPGNNSLYSGTTTQEVLRACCDRLRYVNNQIPDKRTRRALGLLRLAILLLEQRAAKRHGRKYGSMRLAEAEFGRTCNKCNHVGCEGECHKDAQ